MNIDTSTVQKIRITGVDRLDPVTVILEDVKPRHGKIIIECYGQSWSAYWGGMGERSIADFFCSCNNGYLIGKLAPQLRSTVADYDNLDEWLKKGIIERRREHDIDADKARDLWDDVELYCENSEHFLHTEKGHELAQDVIGAEWWYGLPEVENHEYEYLCRIVTAVKDALGSELAKAV